MRWPPYRHVFFDCDSTLTSVEGIDVLAARAGVSACIEGLTRAAMDGDKGLDEVYGERLQTIKPTRGAVRALREVYKRHAVEDAATVIDALMKLGHHVYIISGGLDEPVKEFGISLGVPAENIRAVGVDSDQLVGEWWRARDDDGLRTADRYLDYHKGALAVSDGKADIVKRFVGGQSGSSLLIGDGTSDLLASRAVDLFVGYGGVVARTRVEREAPVFIRCTSLAPVLALAAGPAALHKCRDIDITLVHKTIALVASGALEFREERLRAKFARAWGTQHGALD